MTKLFGTFCAILISLASNIYGEPHMEYSKDGAEYKPLENYTRFRLLDQKAAEKNKPLFVRGNIFQFLRALTKTDDRSIPITNKAHLHLQIDVNTLDIEREEINTLLVDLGADDAYDLFGAFCKLLPDFKNLIGLHIHSSAADAHSVTYPEMKALSDYFSSEHQLRHFSLTNHVMEYEGVPEALRETIAKFTEILSAQTIELQVYGGVSTAIVVEGKTTYRRAPLCTAFLFPDGTPDRLQVRIDNNHQGVGNFNGELATRLAELAETE